MTPAFRQLGEVDLAPDTHPWAVRATGLRVRAGLHLAVDGLDLRLGPGVHGLLGPNGAGKTTLLRALATVIRPVGGELSLFGEDVADRRGLRGIRRRLGYLPQSFGTYPRMTVREFVGYLAWLKEVHPDDIPEAVQRAIDRVGLTDRAGSRQKTLSGGMLRRAGIAQALVNDPDLLLLDEPTVGLDPEQRFDFRRLLRELGTDCCVLIATHLVEDVAAACNDVVLMDAGQLVWQGTPESLAGVGSAADAGDSPIERGYSAALRSHRGGSAR